jgi:hypothetical protein
MKTKIKIEEVKNQLTYVQAQFENTMKNFPENEKALSYWKGMIEAYKITLNILESEGELI